MAKKIVLPGAKRFSKFLRKKAKGTLSLEGPERRVDNGVEYNVWAVLLNGNKIGDYFMADPKIDSEDLERKYIGRVPGYRNELAVIVNEGQPEDTRMPLDLVCLIYSNKESEPNQESGIAGLVVTPWQRQDGHPKIPFP